MSGFWLVSYALLWVVVALMGLLVVGLLRQVGALHLQLSQAHDGRAGQDTEERAGVVPPLEQDGPALGSPLPEWAREVAGWADEAGAEPDGNATGPASRAATLLMFLSPLCETCQHVVEPLNALAADPAGRVLPAAVIRADRMAYEAFLNVFPLHVPTLRDSDRSLTMELGVHRAPFGLLYDRDGKLVCKGLAEDGDDLTALVDAGLGGEAPTEATAATAAKIVREERASALVGARMHAG